MENRNFKAAASASPPTAPVTPSNGYPTDGNPSTGTPATLPGAFWFHKIGEELRAVITGFGLTPSDTELNQVYQAITRVGLRFTQAGGLGFSTNTSITLAQLNGWGQLQTSGITITLPPLSTVQNGSTFTLAASAYSGTIKGSGADQIGSSYGMTNTFNVNAGETITFVCNGTFDWAITSDGFGLTSFQSSLLAASYQVLPSGQMTQTGIANTNSSGIATFTYPVAFTVAARSVQLTFINGSLAPNVFINAGTPGTTSATAFVCNAAGTPISGAAVQFTITGK